VHTSFTGSTVSARDERSLLMRFHTQTAGVSLTAQQPLNNIVRTAIDALAGVLDGTQSLHTNSFDEALTPLTEEAVRVAMRTQQIIAEETEVANAIDPLGRRVFHRGADRPHAQQAYEYFHQIDELGGMVEEGEIVHPLQRVFGTSSQTPTFSARLDARRALQCRIRATSW
jgi:methylmalonyl-CoA mutase, N-terminal domain